MPMISCYMRFGWTDERKRALAACGYEVAM
jgi:hypothetical protein